MSTVNSPSFHAAHLAAQSPSSPRRYLYGPAIDFLLLGGGSLVALLLISLCLGNDEEAKTISLVTTLALANFINHPHFAHSYQIFYSDFRSKLHSAAYPRSLRLRYLYVGIVAPIAIAIFLAWSVMAGQPRILGIAANAMFFLVGWHYVKQGYGMAMVDAVLKRAFYDNAEKRALLLNSYATWILSWLLINHLFAGMDKDYFGLSYFVIPVDAKLVALAAAACLTTTVWTAYTLCKRQHAGKPIAWNGLLAYAASLYAWLLIRDPVVLLWVPLFHSLQYLAVVWRFQLNRIRNEHGRHPSPIVSRRARMVLFLFVGFVLGYAGFWLLPEWLSANVSYDESKFGSGLFYFLIWIFINIHHYLLDTVMWRKGNPDIAEHLFNSKP